MMKRLDMSWMKQFCSMLTLGAACAGCVSYPFIDESIAKLDANPAPVAQRFNLPETPPLKIAPQIADMLVGDWMTGVEHLGWRKIGQDGLIHDFEGLKDEKHIYRFTADGSYSYHYLYRLGAWVSQMKTFGKWSYDSGVLTLKWEMGQFRIQDFQAKERGIANWDQEAPIPMSEPKIETYLVEWFANNEIAITHKDETPPPLTGSRTDVRFDAHGVRIKREIMVIGIREGRETGTVDETIYPPMHFKKEGKGS